LSPAAQASAESCSAKRWPPRARSCSAKASELGLEGIVSKRAASIRAEKPQLAEGEEPELRQDVTAMPRDYARAPTLAILCEACGPHIYGV
jgi:hypothetical protein